MKRITGLFVFLLVYACRLQKAPFVLPREMLPHVQTEYQKRCDKGYVLYNLNCASCHNVGSGKRGKIPDFDQEKLQGYGLRISNARHESSMPDSLVTEEELVLISDFLRFKKRVGISAHRSAGKEN